jgi:transcriptional regulator with GAF, ATPase, and Fis domain
MSTGDPSAPTETGAPSWLAPGAARLEQLHLVFSPRKGGGATVTLGAEPLVVGRDPEGEHILRLDDAQVSRSHVRVERGAAGAEIVDLGSRNGVYVDGVRRERGPLRHGSVIRVGRSLLVFVTIDVPEGARLEPESPGLLGGSAAMHRVRGEIATVAASDMAVLVLGETGVGKERVAHEIHRLSGRTGAFVPVNCAAIPRDLAESELFGHAAGAFSGAVQRREGLFEAAHGGTLFLDEVAELPASVQPKLLRALGNREVRPVGRSETRTVDVRIVAATLRPLEEPDFRADLFARLAAWTVRIPPLRDRRDDILRLAQNVLEARGSSAVLSTGAAETLLRYDWPRNVRQLEQVVDAAAVRAGDERVIRSRHLPAELGQKSEPAPVDAPPAEPPLELLVARDAIPSQTELRLVLDRLGGNLARVATYFGKDRRQVYRWLERFGIDAGAYRDDGD